MKAILDFELLRDAASRNKKPERGDDFGELSEGVRDILRSWHIAGHTVVVVTEHSLPMVQGWMRLHRVSEYVLRVLQIAPRPAIAVWDNLVELKHEQGRVELVGHEGEDSDGALAGEREARADYAEVLARGEAEAERYLKGFAEGEGDE